MNLLYYFNKQIYFFALLLQDFHYNGEITMLLFLFYTASLVLWVFKSNFFNVLLFVKIKLPNFVLRIWRGEKLQSYVICSLAVDFQLNLNINPFFIELLLQIVNFVKISQNKSISR